VSVCVCASVDDGSLLSTMMCSLHHVCVSPMFLSDNSISVTEIVVLNGFYGLLLVTFSAIHY